MMKQWVRLIGLDALIVAAWLLSVGLVVLHERGGWRGTANPAASLGATLEAKEQWFGLYYQGQQVGFSQLSMTPEERDGVPGVSLVDRGRLVFTLMGTPQQLEVGAHAFIDADWRLQRFAASIQTSAYQLRWDGQRQGETLVVKVSTPTGSVTKRLSDPTGSAFVNGLSSWVAFHRLRVGESGRAWVLNPLALNPEAVYFSVRRSEVLDGKTALVVETDVSGLTTTTWVTPSGEVLKERSPLGWELRSEPREDLLRHLTDVTSPAVDLLSTTAVPVDRPIEHPQDVERLTLLVEGIEGDAITIQRPWQRVFRKTQWPHPLPPGRSAATSAEGGPSPVATRQGVGWAALQQAPPPDAGDGPWCIVQLERPHGPDPERTLPATGAPPKGIQRYQRPSLFVQSDNARIIAKATEIVGERTTPWERTVALNQWVFSTLTKRLTVGLPSALDVLATPAGDCHEHTILFTALARSVGIPTRMVAGLVYWQGQFYYHAWPEVWVEGWVPTDPTLNQFVADATHLGLIEGENENLIALGQFIGRLRLRVLASE